MSQTISTWQQYARAVVRVDDLDPTYGFMNKARKLKGDAWANRMVTHLLLFYDLGGAVRCAENSTEDDFWNYVTHGYHLFNRGTERRHSRGELGKKYIANLRDRGTPSEIMEKLYGPTYTELYRNVLADFDGCGFGPYFIWKIMDIQDRCLGRPISLSLAEACKYMPDQPRKCAGATFPQLCLEDAIREVTDAVEDLPAPGCETRGCGYSEAETILCTIHSFFNTKTYSIGDDVHKRHKQLKEFPELLPLLPPDLDWSQYKRA